GSRRVTRCSSCAYWPDCSNRTRRRDGCRRPHAGILTARRPATPVHAAGPRGRRPAAAQGEPTGDRQASDPESVAGWRMTRDDQVLGTPRRLAPGLALATLAVGAAVAAWRLQPSVSPLLTGLLIGALLANLPRLPAGLWRAADPGLRFASKRLLRIGIVLLGLQLVLEEIVALGIGLIVSAVFIVAASMLSILYIGGRIGISLRMRILIASGFSICGAAAVAAVGDVVKADEEDVAVSLGLVVLFGSIMIPVIPLAGMLLGMPDVQIAVWAGGSILEVAQVVAAAGAVGTGLLATAVLVKLSRVLMLAP